MLYSNRALKTIHMTGHNAKTAPAAAASNARRGGNCQPSTATTSATSRPASEACHAGRRSTPSNSNTVAIGKAATRNDNGRLPAIGVSC